MSRPASDTARTDSRPANLSNSSSKSGYQLNLRRFFTTAGQDPLEEAVWVRQDAVIGNGEKKNFEQKGVEFPEFWSQNAVAITASKYFRGKLGTPERETSLRQMINRVTGTIREWGEKMGYFEGETAEIFEAELQNIILTQKGSFNSPVWFNVGTTATPQCSACFILSVEDNMSSILDWIKTEGKIFKGGSGAGASLSRLRSKRESLSSGGRASGPVSFMRGADSVAGMIKSGGVTRRAAKMVVLDIDHPDIMDFIRCKSEEEKKVRALMAAGYNMGDLNDPAWESIQYQNANNSVRVTDDFMRAVEKDGEWQTHFRKSGSVADVYNAREVLREIAEAAWASGDPGLQFDTTINRWHTCPNSGRINASNPCSEYMHLDNSACNLASINLLKFLRPDGTFAVEEFKHTVDVFILAQDILVSGSSYPTEEITKNARAFRELGLGFANLGALLMTKGLPYDSEGGEALAAAVASVMSGEAYRFSTRLARRVGAYEGFAANKEPQVEVLRMHRNAAREINYRVLKDEALAQESLKVWDQAIAGAEQHGVRNSQVSVIAPTGTIAFMMDCDTTGIEPDFSLVKMKQLVGGGWMKIVNGSVRTALMRLGYSESEVAEIEQYVYDHGMVEGSPHIKDEHLAVFDCAMRPSEGQRSISWQGHVRMVAAVQPFVSGAISKTFNMPNEATVDDIYDAYLMAWRLGIKAFAVYRDGSKATQPLSSGGKKKEDGTAIVPTDAPAAMTPYRRRLPPTRKSETHKFSVAGHEGYLTYSLYENEEPAELFLRVSKQGSTLSGLLDAFAIAISLALQYGVPLKALAHKYIHSRFEPSGFTENPEIRIATSILDYIFRFMALRFLSDEDLSEFGMERTNGVHIETPEGAKDLSVDESVPVRPVEGATASDGHGHAKSVNTDIICRRCGGFMVRTGTCLTCRQCGTSSGGCS